MGGGRYIQQQQLEVAKRNKHVPPVYEKLARELQKAGRD